MSKPTPDEVLDHTPITFGKYGPDKHTPPLTPDQIAAKDPAWLIWAYETVKNRPVCSRILYEACVQDKEEFDDPRPQDFGLDIPFD